MILNHLSHKTTFALFSFGVKKFPNLSTPAFVELLNTVALGQTLATMVGQSKVFRYTSPDWQQECRVRQWLACIELQATFQRFEAETHAPGHNPVMGYNVRQWLAVELTHADRELFLFFLEVLAGAEPQVDMKAKADDETVALSSRECGYCCRVTKDIISHVKGLEPPTRKWDGHYHQRTNVDQNFSCPSCQMKFKTRSQRTKHVQKTTGDCVRGQTRIMRQHHLQCVARFVEGLRAALDDFLQGEARRDKTPMDFARIRKIYQVLLKYQ